MSAGLAALSRPTAMTIRPMIFSARALDFFTAGERTTL